MGIHSFALQTRCCPPWGLTINHMEDRGAAFQGLPAGSIYYSRKASGWIFLFGTAETPPPNKNFFPEWPLVEPLTKIMDERRPLVRATVHFYVIKRIELVTALSYLAIQL